MARLSCILRPTGGCSSEVVWQVFFERYPRGLLETSSKFPIPFVTIGRAFQPFPCPKRSMRFSPHSAFQLGQYTQRERTRRHLRRGAPATMDRHLLSPLHPFVLFSFGLPWRTFTLSWPLQPGIWLLRRLRPPCRARAFSRPTPWVMRCGSSPVPAPMPLATRSCLLDAERSWEQPPLHFRVNGAAAFPFWARCASHFHLSIVTTLHPQVPHVSIGCRISLVIRLWLPEASTWSAGFAPRRVPLVDARRLILTSLLKRDPFGASIGAIKGRT